MKQISARCTEDYIAKVLADLANSATDDNCIAYDLCHSRWDERLICEKLFEAGYYPNVYFSQTLYVCKKLLPVEEAVRQYKATATGMSPLIEKALADCRRERTRKNFMKKLIQTLLKIDKKISDLLITAMAVFTCSSGIAIFVIVTLLVFNVITEQQIKSFATETLVGTCGKVLVIFFDVYLVYMIFSNCVLKPLAKKLYQIEQ